ncbi:hypothetical protein NW766_005991 [Fusarium irregulare]|uniref:Uncharacterized protein n=1 Tax=Fusarium irregulare TaxID=2494466 RepID=A0A9W8UA03_9HYPO|nr:hypothetical protein NW766_005991 [Fusarium irregulare]
MKKSLKALYLHISLPVNAGFEDGGVLNTLKGLRHLSLYKEDFWDSNAGNKVGAEMLIWNPRSTMRSIELNESIFHRMHRQWEETGDKPPRQGYLSALKSFSVIWGIFDHEETDAIIQAIDFVKLEELKLGRGNTGTGLLYRRLINAFSTAGKENIRLGSLQMNLEVDPDDGIEFLASFDTLTRLSICDSGVHIADSENYSLDDSLLQGLFMHKNLTTLKLTNKNSNLEGDRKLELDAQMVSKFIINFPNLRHLHFYFDERQLKEIAEPLSHGKKLEKICAKTHTWGFSYDKRLDTARRFLHYLARPVLEHGPDQANFRWEDHTKIKYVVCNRVKFEVGSRFEKTKGAKKALKIESPWDSKSQVLYRHVLGNSTIIKQGIDVMRKWADKVSKDLD